MFVASIFLFSQVLVDVSEHRASIAWRFIYHYFWGATFLYIILLIFHHGLTFPAQLSPNDTLLNRTSPYARILSPAQTYSVLFYEAKATDSAIMPPYPSHHS